MKHQRPNIIRQNQEINNELKFHRFTRKHDVQCSSTQNSQKHQHLLCHSDTD